MDDFLKRQNLVLRDTLLDIPPPAVDPPSLLTPAGRDEFQIYLLSPPHKAFAASPGGRFATSARRRTAEDAEKRVLENCKKSAGKDDPCVVVMIDDKKMQDSRFSPSRCEICVIGEICGSVVRGWRSPPLLRVCNPLGTGRCNCDFRPPSRHRRIGAPANRPQAGHFFP